MDWRDLPRAAQQELTSLAGNDQFNALTGGYSGGVTGILGRVLFVKAVPSDDPAFADLRIEARVAAGLSGHVSTPVLRLGEMLDGWFVLAFDVAPGRMPNEPWQRDDLDLVLHALDAATDALTPSPVPALPTVTQRMRGRCTTFRLLHAGEARDAFTPDHLHEWERRNLRRLAELEGLAETALVGQTLLHFDLRHDNLLIDDRTITFLDWGRASIGPAWVDVACLLLESAVDGAGLDTLFRSTRRGSAADPTEVDMLLTLFASYWRHAATLSADSAPGLQARRHFSAQATLNWLADRWAR